MANPFKVVIDAVDRSAHVEPSTVQIVRNLENRANTAEFFVSRLACDVTYYQNPALLPGIVAWWHMDEASGNLADASGNGLTLTAGGSPTGYQKGSLAPGYGGESILLDGDDDRFASTAAALRFVPPLSVGGWIKPINASLTPSVMASTSSVIGTDGFELGYTAATNVPLLTFVADNVYTIEAPLLFDGRPHHIVATLTAGFVVRVYFDGELLGTTTLTGALAGAAGFALGTNALIPSTPVAGRMDEWFLSNQVLTAGVVRDLYAQGREAVELLQLDELSSVLITNDAGDARFGGYIVRSRPVREAGLTLGWEAKCIGWEHRFQSVVASYAAFNKRTDQIISEIFAADASLSGFDLSRVRQGRTVASYFKQDAYVGEILDDLAAIDSYQWYVTPDGTQLVYRRLTMDVTAAWHVSDVPSEVDAGAVAMQGFEVDRDMFDPVSRVIVRGASDIEEWNPKAFANLGGNGPIDVIGPHLMPLDGQDNILVEFNEASGGTPSYGDPFPLGIEDKDTLQTELDLSEVATAALDGNQTITDATTALQVVSTSGFPSSGSVRIGVSGPPIHYTSKTGTHFQNISTHDRDAHLNGATVYNISSGYRGLYSPSRGRIRWDQYTRPPNITAYDTAFGVYAQIRTNIRVEMREQAARKRLGAEYTKRIIDETLTSKRDAIARARRELKEGQKPRVTVKGIVQVDVDSTEYKLQVGHLLHVRNTFHGVDTYTLRDEGSDGLQVQQITSYGDTGGSQEFHELVLGTWPKTELDWAMEIARRLDRVEVKDFWDDFRPEVSIDTGWGGDPQDTDGVLKFTRPTVTIAP